MPWYRVKIPSSDVAKLSAAGLMNKFAQAYHAAGVPAGVRVYHGTSPAGDHIYYFSPEAAAVAGELLRQFGATSCPSEPDLSGFRPVKL